MIHCKICNTATVEYDKAKILSKYTISYFRCPSCGFIQTEEPYWLDESYAESINTSDTGIMQRNLLLARQSMVILKFFFNTQGKYLDFAGGYGIYTRLMRDFGFDFYWYDKFSKNLVARGFEHSTNQTYDLVTVFECFEHFVNPKLELQQILKQGKTVLFTTELVPKSNPKPEQWWYYGLDHGQHIALYTYKSLQILANNHGLNFYSNGKNFHLFTDIKISGVLFKFVTLFNGVFYHSFKHMLKSKTQSDFNVLRQPV